MVPLAAYGKVAPPPPRARTDWRTLAISLAVALVLVGIFGWWIASSRSQERSFWSQTSALDQRNPSG
jgi:hypothetical protein